MSNQRVPENYIGKKFGRWTVNSFSGEVTTDGRPKVLCECDCGNTRLVKLDNLINGISQSCGCRWKDIVVADKTISEIGKRYGGLIVVEQLPANRDRRTMWRCVCDCGNEATVSGRELRNGTKISCLDCGKKRNAESKMKDRSGMRFGSLIVLNRNKEDKNKVDCICDCGKLYTTNICSLVSGFTKLCTDCQTENRKSFEFRSKLSAKLQRVSIDEWGGFTCTEKYKIRRSPEYNNWRRSVFERDAYACQKCGKKGGNGKNVILNAHHIFNFMNNESMRFDVNNGITLCENCHSIKFYGSFHRIYGTYNNTPEQLYEFLSSPVIGSNIA